MSAHKLETTKQGRCKLTANEMQQATNGRRFFRVPSGSRKESIFVEVRVVDTRSQFGRVDVRISPVAGSGSMWVSLDNLATEEQLKVSGVL